MNIAGIDYESINDGEGVRTTIFVSGCSHKCPNCHNPQTHDVNYGIEFTDKLKNEIIDNIKKRPFISGITLSGGDPLYSNNLSEVLIFIKEIKSKFPNKTIWIYTGYEFKEILNNPLRTKIAELCDVIVDGRYIDSLADLTYKWAGSTNQRVIDVKKSLEHNSIVLYE